MSSSIQGGEGGREGGREVTTKRRQGEEGKERGKGKIKKYLTDFH